MTFLCRAMGKRKQKGRRTRKLYSNSQSMTRNGWCMGQTGENPALEHRSNLYKLTFSEYTKWEGFIETEETNYVNPVRGRLTGSDSIDTLVQVGLAKTSGLRQSARRVVLQDFSACTGEELTVMKGDIVYILHHDHDWFYVTTPGGRVGYIPASFCGRGKYNPPEAARDGQESDPPKDQTPKYTAQPTFTRLLPPTGSNFTTPIIKPSLPKLPSYQELYGTHHNKWSKLHCSPSGEGHGCNETIIMPFHKEERGRSMVLFDFMARNENDLEVRRGEIVLCLNDEDREWIWVRRGDNMEGFVPYTYLCPLGY